MSNINNAAVLNPFSELTSNILEYVPRATTSKFGVVSIGSGINVDAFGRIYLDTQEYSDRLAAIEAQAASSLATQKSEVAAAIAQVNLAQSQTITALTLEVSSLKTNIIDSISATQTELLNRADQLAQNVTNITQQLTQDKAAFTKEIQDALVNLENASYVASALRTPRKINGTDFDGRNDITTNAWGATRTIKIGNKTNSINGSSNVDYSLAAIGAFPDVGGTIQGSVEVTGNLYVGGTVSATLKGTAASANKLQVARKIQGVDFDGTSDISLPTFTTQTDGLVPKRVGTTTTKYLREDGTWVVPPDTTYALLTAADAEAGTATSANSISAKVLKDAIKYHAPTVTNIVGNAGTATKLQTPRTINGILFDGTQNISLPEPVAYSLPTASASVLGGIKVGSGLVISNSVLSVGTLNQSTTGNAATATKLQTPRTITLTGNVTGSASFDGSANASITTAITGLGVANGIATLDSNGQVPSTQLPSYVDDVLEYLNVAAFPTTGETGKIYVEATGNTTYRWSGTGYIKITSGEVSSVAGKTGVVTLTKADVGLPNVDNTADSTKSVASAAKLTTARTIGGISFDGTANINLPGVNTAGNQNTSGNAGSASKLATARTLTVGRTGKNFDGSDNITWAATEVLPTATSGQFLKFDGTDWIAAADNDTTYSAMTQAEANTGTETTGRVITAAILKGAIQTHAPVQTAVTGNAGSATKLATSRTINGVAFDGTANITIADSTKVPLTGGTMTGNLNANALGVNNTASTGGLGLSLYGGSSAGMPDYGLAFSGTAAFGTHGSVDGNWATYFTMSGATNQGWIFKSGNAKGGNVASISATGAFTATSILSSGNVTAYSDIRIKDNITIINDALNKVNQLKGVTYNRTDTDDKDKRYVGLIAQDVQAVMPEAVNVNDDEINTLSVDYQGLVGLLVESIKELKAEIDELKEKVK